MLLVWSKPFCLFLTALLATAYKSLWRWPFYFVALLFIKDTSEKRQAADAFLADIVTAFDKLDTSDKLAAILCEANHLIKLPYLVPDPVSVKPDSQTNTLNSLADKFNIFPPWHPLHLISLTSLALPLTRLLVILRSSLTNFLHLLLHFLLLLKKYVKFLTFLIQLESFRPTPTVSARLFWSLQQHHPLWSPGAPST